MKIGFLVIATGKYIEFVDPLWRSIKKYTKFPSNNLHLFVFTDKPELFSDPRVTPIFQEHRSFPYPTLMRYHFFTNSVNVFAEMDYLFYCDADMRFVNNFGDEILGDLVTTLHPGFFNKSRNEFTYERNSKSSAFIEYNEGEKYFCGGFNGGKRKNFLAMAKTISEMIDLDIKKKIVAIWHDESYLNRYLLKNKPTKILSPSYCYPENWHLPYEPILMALDKKHNAMRFSIKKRFLLTYKKMVNQTLSLFNKIPYSYSMLNVNATKFKVNNGKTALVTGSAGLVGSESVRFLIDKGYKVVGVDNNMREYFFGSDASTDWNRKKLEREYHGDYIHRIIDIRDNNAIEKVFQEFSFDMIVHAAAQPSHDWAAKEPFTDFSVNATGTLVLLENFRKYAPSATFIFTSTNKVYGDTPNQLPLIELEKRFEIDPAHRYRNGIDESISIDNSKHSIFGASKTAADIMVQEYGKYFGLSTGVFRVGCITGPSHSGTQLHGFLSYLVKCIATEKLYTIFGYKGKQVRDNIHSYDLVNIFWHYHQEPRQGEIYNVGGSRHSNVSILEAIEAIEKRVHKKAIVSYVDANRSGDHIWYVSDISKFKRHYPDWNYKYDINEILDELCTKSRFI